MSGFKARLYLDVDGVLSPLRRDDRRGVWPPATWSAWVDPQVCNSTPFAVGLLDDLVSLAADGDVEIVWATTWPADMIHQALTAAGYPTLRFRHLAADGRINKHTAIRDDARADPLPFVWVDDAHWPGDLSWRSPAPRLRVTPYRHDGLTPDEWATIRRWLADNIAGAVSEL